MLVNKKYKNGSRVKFINYTGQYPCLCCGILTLEIDGVQYNFGDDYSIEVAYDSNFPKFWSTGGEVTHDKDWNWDIRKGEWIVDVDKLPEQFRELAAEIDSVFNNNVKYGCCGGCI